MKVFLFILDTGFLVLSSVLGLGVSDGIFFISGSVLKTNITHILTLSPFWLLFLFLLDFYEVRSITKTVHFVYNLFIFFLFATGSGAIYFYLQPKLGISPKTILLLTALFFCGFIWISRYVIYQIFSKNLKEKIAAIGMNPLLIRLIKNELQNSMYELSTVLIDATEFQTNKSILFSATNDSNKFINTINNEKIKTVLLPQNKNGLGEKLKALYPLLPVDINYISFESFYARLDRKVPVDYIDNAWLLENIPHKDKKLSLISKRLFDILISLIGLAAFVILFPWISLAIKIDSKGPIFYKQIRVGKNGRPFTLLKFRTMAFNAEQKGPQWSAPNDKRVTKVGKVLRKFYLDELLQFYNILVGDLAVVGPRPERPEFIKQLEIHIPFYEIRQTVKPGLTGWAQVNFRASSTLDEAKEKFKYDLYYIQNRSFLFDLSIVLKTAQKILL